MSQTYGIAAHGTASLKPHREPVRYVVLIDAGGAGVAMVFLASREKVGEFDAGATEVSTMTAGIMPTVGAVDPAWDLALSGHSKAERAEARVYDLGG